MPRKKLLLTADAILKTIIDEYASNPKNFSRLPELVATFMNLIMQKERELYLSALPEIPCSCHPRFLQA